MAGEGEDTDVEKTPTYSVAFTAFVFIMVSLLVERAIHRLKKYLKRTNQKPLRKMLDKMTEELMLLGFISLLLTVLQGSLIKICVPHSFSRHLLPCSNKDYVEAESAEAPAAETHVVSNIGRRLLRAYVYTAQAVPEVWTTRHLLAEGDKAESHCAAKGKVQFVTVEVLHQLHLFIFVLAVTHVFYWILTVSLAFLRLHHWQKWEIETRNDGYDGNIEMERRYCEKMSCKRPPLTAVGGHAHAFVNRHANHWLYDHQITLWILCFFQQFFASVSREDYLIFRVGFLDKHKLSENFNFRDYVIRSMEVDFKKVIGIDWWLWLFVIAFLLLNVHGWYTYFWAAFIPTILILIIGTKQQHIISTLALQAKRHAQQLLSEQGKFTKTEGNKEVCDIAKAVKPNDNLFWFDNPQLILKLIHFVIFQNSFELAFFFWILTTFGWNSCILGNHALLIVRIVVGIVTQFVTSYSTLPIYALVTQMGSKLKETVFTKDVFEGLKGWRVKANKHAAAARSGGTSENSSVKSLSHGGSRRGAGGGSERSEAPAGENVELQPVAREPQSRTGADHEQALERKCQLMYGKLGGLDVIKSAKASKVGPSPSSNNRQ